jgi:hypothetical protein
LGCALTGRLATAVERAAERLGIREALRLTGFVDDESLEALYRSCRLMLFLSYYEGLGLPVLEALLSGAPVVASNRGAIPEFAGSVSRLVDPSSPGQIALTIEQALMEPRESRLDARQRFASTFSWARTAGRAIAAIRSAATRRLATTPTGGRLRVAWVAPLPPARSSVGRYAAGLLSHLPGDLDIELVVSPEATVEPSLGSRFQVLRSGQVAERHHAAPFDLFVYHLGNGVEHVYMVDMMRRYSGLLSLYDVRLGRLTRAFLDASEAVVVHDAGSWTFVRQLSATPVLHIPLDTEREASLQEAARAYATAIHLTIARRRQRDGEWCDGAAVALAEVAGEVEIAEGAFERWAQVRRAAVGRRAISEAR